MAIFHASLKSFSRAQGHSAVAAAAYRSGSNLRDDRTGLTHNYSRRAGVVSARLFAPQHAPLWAFDAARLWSAAEMAEARINSRVARELETALPAELDAEQRAALSADIARVLVDRYGVAVMAAIHAPGTGGDQRNHHVHLLFTTRALGPQGFGAKVRVLDDRATGPEEVQLLRDQVAILTNEHLSRAGVDARVDPRTLQAQAAAAEAAGDFSKAALLVREPTSHDGPTLTAARRRGEAAGMLWNTSVTDGNESVLSDFLAKVEAEGRLQDTPQGAGAAQARADRTREITAAPAISPLPQAQMIPRLARASRTSASPSMRIQLPSASTRTSRAHGAGAEILNAQAERADALRRAQAEALQAWLDALHTLARELGEQNQRQVEAYARRVRWSTSAVLAHAAQCARSSEYRAIVRASIRAHQRLEQAETRVERRRNAYGAAMVATVTEQKKLEGIEAERKPKAWRPLSRREWAERRRQQQARLTTVKAVERQAAQAVSEHVLAECAAEEAVAREAFMRVERQRRKADCLPGGTLRRPRRAFRSEKMIGAADPTLSPLGAEIAARLSAPSKRPHRPPGRAPRI